MTPRTRSLLALMVLATAASSSIWLLTGLSGPASGPGGVTGPGWYFDGARLVSTGRDGSILYRVESPRIVQDSEDGSARLQEPVVHWMQGDAPPLTIHARSGRVSADSPQLWLGGGVSILDDTGGQSLEFRTTWLHIDTRTQLAMTDQQVLVVTPQGEFSGRGLVADMSRGTIRLESEVRGRYVR